MLIPDMQIITQIYRIENEIFACHLPVEFILQKGYTVYM